MNIYAEPGDRVVFANPTHGYPSDKERCATHLEVGETYTVDYTDVSGCHTDVCLHEFPGIIFNSVMFEDFVEGMIANPSDMGDIDCVLDGTNQIDASVSPDMIDDMNILTKSVDGDEVIFWEEARASAKLIDVNVQLGDTLKRTEELLESYQTALNKIDDYFEYRFDSEKDKKYVMGVIDNLTEQLVKNK